MNISNFKSTAIHFVFLFILAILTGCGERAPKFKSTDITGADFGRDFMLTDHSGQVRRLADFKGKVVVVFFGFTHCPDVCPTTLSELASAMKKLGKDASRVQVIFITLDPQRDTQALLAQYVPSFNPSFLGLYGNEERTAAVAKEFKVFYQKQPARQPGSYTVDHSAGTYIFDSQGRIRLYVAYGQGADVFAHDIAALLSSGA